MDFCTCLTNPGPWLHASEVDYEDCTRLITICPACEEPVLKKGSAITRLQYFSHFVRKAGSADCEFRVRVMARDRLQSQVAVALPTHQELAEFLKQFETILLEREFVSVEPPNTVGDHIAWMRRRPVYRQTITICKAAVRKLCLEREFDHQEEMSIITRFIFTGLTFRALLFATSFGLITGEGEAPDRYQHLLATLSDRDLRSLLVQPRGGERFCHAMVNAVCRTASLFLYSVSQTRRR